MHTNKHESKLNAPKQIQTAEEELESPKGELKSNMPADAEILLGGE